MSTPLATFLLKKVTAKRAVAGQLEEKSSQEGLVLVKMREIFTNGTQLF